MCKRKKQKCGIKCSTCENYDKKTDFCKERGIENCSKNPHTDFSQCESFLIRENLVMF